MNAYVREIRGMLENLGVVRRPPSWMGGFMTGIGFGVVAGAAVAALMTPSNGKEMRRLVRTKARQIANRAQKKASALKEDHVNGAREQLHG
jgi:gas vesicle protein